MSKVLIIGAGGVSRVVVHKCSQRRDVFSSVTLASRTKSNCDAIAAEISDIEIKTTQVDADNVPELTALKSNSISTGVSMWFLGMMHLYPPGATS